MEVQSLGAEQLKQLNHVEILSIILYLTNRCEKKKREKSVTESKRHDVGIIQS